MQQAEILKPEQQTPRDLRAEREARGLSLEQIFERTRVGILHLAAVENGDWDRLPPPVYARDFIRKYARAVGVDEAPLLEKYGRHLDSRQPEAGEQPIRKPWPETGRRLRFLIASLAALIVAGLLVSALFLYDQGGRTESPNPPAGSPPAAEPVPAPAAADPPPPPPATAEKPAAAVPDGAGRAAPAEATYRLGVEAREPTWIRITGDGSSRHEALLKPGDRIERTASDHFELWIGNAGGIELTFQGKPLGRPGKPGQVLRLRLPAEKTGNGTR